MTTLRCHNCGARVEAELGETDLRLLRSQGHLTRACRECGGPSPWELHGSSEPTRLPSADLAGLLRGRILLIDDDDSVLAVLSRALSRQRCEVVTANSAREALTLLARGDYDLVLSDIRMPEFDGQRLFEFLEEHMPEQKDRVVFMTGDLGNPETVKFLQQVGRPYVAKPIELPALLELVRRCLAGETPEPVPAPGGGREQEWPREETTRPVAPPPRRSVGAVGVAENPAPVAAASSQQTLEKEAFEAEVSRREASLRQELEAGAQEQQRLQAEIRRWQQAAEGAQRERDEAHGRLQEAEGLRGRLAEVEGSSAARETELRQEIQEATRRREGLEADVVRWQRAATEARAAAEPLQRELEELRDRVGALQQEVQNRAVEVQLQQKLGAAERAQEELRADVLRWQQAATDAGAEAERMRQEVEKLRGRADARQQEAQSRAAEAEPAGREAELQQQLSAAKRAQEELQAEVRRWQTAAQQTEAAAEQTRKELAELRQGANGPDRLRKELLSLEGELARAREETHRLRREMEQQREQILASEAAPAGGEPADPAELEREARRLRAQREVLHQEFNRAELRAQQLENALRRFYQATVNPLTVAVASAEMAAASQWLSPHDREHVRALKKNLDQILEALRLLRAWMGDLGISIS